MKTVKQITEEVTVEFMGGDIVTSQEKELINEIVKLRREVINLDKRIIDVKAGMTEGYDWWEKESKAHEATKQEHEEALAEMQRKAATKIVEIKDEKDKLRKMVDDRRWVICSLLDSIQRLIEGDSHV